MSEAFTAPQPELFTPQPEQNMFEGVQAETTDVGQAASDPVAQDKASKVLALAQTDPQKPDIIGQMQSLVQSTNDTIKRVGDADIRNQIAAKSQLDDLKSYTGLIQDRDLQQSDPTIGIGAAIAAKNTINLDNATRAKYAAEQEAVKRIQDVAAMGDNTQARVLMDNLQNGDANQIIRDTNTKQLILEREIARAKDATDGDWLGSAANFVLSVVPLYGSTAHSGNVDIENSLKHWYDGVFSGRRLQSESNTLWNMPVADFSDYVKDHLIPTIKQKSDFLGFHDNNKALSTLQQIARPSGILTTNSNDALGNLGWIGPAELTKMVSLPSMLIRNGARKESQNLVANAAAEVMTKGAAAETQGMTTSEIIDHMLPDAVNPQTQVVSDVNKGYQPGVKGTINSNYPGESYHGFSATIKSVEDSGGLNVIDQNGGHHLVYSHEFTPQNSALFTKGETEAAASIVSNQQSINDIVDRVGKTLEAFQNLKQLGRLTDAEMQDAVDATIAKVKTTYGENLVKDVAVKDIKLSDGTGFKRVEFTLGEFETPDQARKFAFEVGLGDNVQLEGWASNADRVVRVEPGVPVVKQKAFASWFGKSKVTADNKVGSEPLKLYHGTTKEFKQFDPTKSGFGGSFFATDAKTTMGFNYSHGGLSPYNVGGGKTYAVYVKAENPFDPFHNLDHREAYKNFLMKPENKYLWESYGKGGYYDENDDLVSATMTDEILKGKWNVVERNEVQAWIKAQGHDGAWVWSPGEGRNIMVYNADQIINAIEPSDLNGKILRDESGIYSFRTTKDVSETGFHTEVLSPHATGFISRMILSSRQVGDRLLSNFAQGAGNTRAKLLKTYQKTATDVIHSLSLKERSDLAQVLAVGEQRGEWYSRDELEALYERAYKRPPSQKEFDAYDVARNVNDIEYLNRNDELYKTKVVQGFETVSLDQGMNKLDRVNARIHDTYSIGPKDRVYDASGGVHWSEKNPLSSERLQQYKDEGYKLLELDQAQKLSDGTTVKSILAKTSDLKIENLERQQIPYRAGGHRMYQGKYFAKQARIGLQPDGEKFLQNPGTFIVGKTKAEVQHWVDQMEAAREAFTKGASAHELNEILPSYMKGEEFINNIHSGTFDEHQPFRTMFDRETLPEYTNTGHLDLRSNDEGELEQYLRTNGRMYYSGKGEVLPDWQGSMAPTLDPYQTIQRSLQNVANLSSFSDYKITAAERWSKTFGGYLEQQGLSPMGALRSGTFGLNVPEAIRQGAEAQRAIIRRTLSWRTEFDRQQEIYTRRFAEWVAGSDPYSLRNKVTSSISTWFDNHHPVQALRGMAFDLKLGLFNVAQFPLQIGTLVAATTISPKLGMQGMATLMPLRAYLTKSGSEAMLDELVGRGVHGMGGFTDPKEFKEFFRQAKESGFFDIGGTHQLVNDGGPNAATASFKAIDNVRAASRFWFNEGEVWNRAVAWRIAWGETKEKLPGLAVTSNDFQRELAGRAEEYAFSMSEQSGAAWQKGITSIPTQFWAYQARMLEAMFGKTFTGEQRVRLMLGQTLLYGAAGVPIAPFISDQIKKRTGVSPGIDTVGAFLDRGILDEAIYHMTGQNILVSKRYGQGSFISDTVKDLFGFSAYGEKSTAEMLGGASGSIGLAGFETIGEIIKYASAESGGEYKPLTRDAVIRFAQNSSTFSNAYKAYLVYKYGTLVSQKGTTMASGLPSQDAFSVAIGLAPAETDQVTSAMLYLQDNKQQVDDLSKSITNFRTRFVNEPDNRDDINQSINMQMKLADPAIRLQAIQKAQKHFEPSMLSGLQLQIQRDRVRSETLKSMNEGNPSGSDSNP